MKRGSQFFGLAFAFLASVALATGLQAQGKAEPVTVVSHVDIKPDAYMPKASETSARLFRAESAATKRDAGLIGYEILQEVNSSNHFTIVETWRDATAYELHVGSDHTVHFRQEIQPFLGSPFDSRVHHLFK